MPGKTDARKELGNHTRQRLLRAARRLLAERGMGGVRLRDVAEAAEVNIAAVSYHFGSLASLVNTAVREAAEAALSEQAKRLASLPPDAPLEDIVAAWIRPTVHGLQEDREAGALLRIASRAITEAPADMREWAQDIMERAHGQLIARLRPALPGLEDRELAFRVFWPAASSTGSTRPPASPSRPPRPRLTWNGCSSPLSRTCSPAPRAPAPGVASRGVLGTAQTSGARRAGPVE
jgi:AcrR family transcriptional regulator